MIQHLVDAILNLPPWLVLGAVWLLVFAEDALFVGFVIPGESAAVVAGVAASLGHLPLWAALVVVVSAAIIGDTVGYEVGKHWFTRLLELRIVSRHRGRIDGAREFLRKRGGPAVFLGRFTAFFRAVMPALAGTSRMPYRTFLAYNAAGGLAWGIGFVLLGYAAGRSYQAIAKQAGTYATVVVAVIVVVVAVVMFVRHRRAAARESTD